MAIIVNKELNPFSDLNGVKGYHGHVLKRLVEVAEKKQGEIVLSYREIFGGYDGVPGCFYTPSALYTTHFEAGILDGILYGAEAERGWTPIPLREGMGRGSSGGYYSVGLSTGIAIPVKNKIISDSLSLDIASLERISEEGKLEMGFLEFFSAQHIPGYTLNTPYLTNFALLFGEDEIRDFVENHDKYVSGDNYHSLVSMARTKAEGFLNLMQLQEKNQIAIPS